MIELSNVSLGYGAQGPEVVSGVSLRARAGELLGIVGPNGYGKSTLLRGVTGLLRPRSGRVTLDGAPVQSLRPSARARRIAVVSQEESEVAPLTVYETVALGRLPHRTLMSRCNEDDTKAINDALRTVEVAELADKQLAELSGGERRRVLIARALAQQADHLVLDEPTNHLDVRYQHQIMRMLRAQRAAVIVVLHDLDLALQYCDRVALMQDGHVTHQGPTAEVLTPEILAACYGIDWTVTEIGGRKRVLAVPPDETG